MVYKIPCADCDWYYVGETGRCFETSKNEHIRNVKTCANGSNIAKHAWSVNHSADLIILVSLTKALFALAKHRKLGTPLLPSILTIILNRFQTSVVFFLNNTHLIYTIMLCFCSSYYFYFAFSCTYFIISHFSFIRRRL